MNKRNVNQRQDIPESMTVAQLMLTIARVTKLEDEIDQLQDRLTRGITSPYTSLARLSPNEAGQLKLQIGIKSSELRRLLRLRV